MKTELITPPATQPTPDNKYPQFYIGNDTGNVWARTSKSTAIRIHASKKFNFDAFEIVCGEGAENWQGHTPITTPFTIKFTP